MLIYKIFERLSIGRINKMEGIVTENNNRHKGGKCNLETLDDSKKRELVDLI